MRGFFVDFLFFFNSALLGVGLAMDAFSVSAANGLVEPNMKKSKEFSISGTFAFFQFLMPMLGWVLVRFAAEQFTAFQKAVPYIALVFLLFIGGKMLYEGIKNKGGNDINGENGEKGEEATAVTKLTLTRLLVQGIATSIDALSVGFTIAEYKVTEALVCSAIVAAMTFGICVAGTYIGKKFGTKLAGKATILGGVILIIIGLEIFIKGVII